MKIPAIIAASACILAATAPAGKNDSIFPPAPAARDAIHFDGKGFVVKGKRTFINSGSIHYPRVPSPLWRDRLLRLKRGGFNTVETYAFWNFHEPRENEFDFTGDRDIAAFYETAWELGLYGIARVGPYVCAEWDFGGFPIWLKFKPSFNLRTADPGYLALNDHWYDRIVPIVARQQIHRGGNIILVQLENEHPKGWGVVDDPYFTHLTKKALSLGVEVPYFLSGLNHGGAPHPQSPDTSKRASPWFTTEFWPGWFNLYGPLQPRKLAAVEFAQWRIIAAGGGGYNFYMLHGGSNFKTCNDPSGAASYDYGAAIGQAGDLRPIYYRMKRANQLTSSFPEILANGDDDSARWKDFVNGNTEVLGARRSSAGTLIFVNNKKNQETTATFKDGGKIRLSPNETSAFPVDITLTHNLKIASSTVRLLGLARNGNTLNLVVHGNPGDTGKLELSAASPLTLVSKCPSFDARTPSSLSITTPANGPDTCVLREGSTVLRIIAVNKDLGLFTWFLGDAGKQFVVLGPSFVTDFTLSPSGPVLTSERAYGKPACGRAVIYGGENETYHLAVNGDSSLDAKPAPALSTWEFAVAPEASPGFDDSKWKSSADPQEMGVDGDTSAFAWYRSNVSLPSGGSGELQFEARNHVRVFINGKLTDPEPFGVQDTRRKVKAVFQPGDNSIAIFTSHAGRAKAFGRTAPALNYDNKGVFSPVSLKLADKTLDIKGWKMRGGIQTAGQSWKKETNPTGALPALYRCTFTAAPPAATGPHPILRVDVSSLVRGTVWLNGRNLGRFPDTIPSPGIYFPECWLKNGANELIVFDEHGTAPSKVRLIVEGAASREVIVSNKPAADTVPMVVPPESEVIDLVAANKGNIAFRQPASASCRSSRNIPENAVDGDTETIWQASDEKSGAWFQVDLGEKSPAIATCEILWERLARQVEYKLEGSADGKTWKPLGDETTAVPHSPDSRSEISRINLNTTKVRYLRVTVEKINDRKPRRAGIREIRAFEP